MTPGNGFFIVRRIRANDTIIVRPFGELDMATVPTLREALSDGDHGPSEVILDLAELSFIDGTGVRALAEAHDEARAKGRSLRVVNPDPWIRKVFDLTSTAYLVQDGSPDGPSSRKEAGRG